MTRAVDAWRARRRALLAVVGLLAAGTAAAQVYPSYGPSVELSTGDHRARVAAPVTLTPHPVDSVSIDYGHQSGHPLTGFLAFPMSARGALPGVILCPDRWGLNEVERHRAQRLAALGYTVLVVDPYQGRIAPTAAAAQALHSAAETQGAALDDNLRQAYAYLRSHLHTKAMAVLGGDLALRADRALPGRFAATVAYAPQATAADADAANGPLLVLAGDEDATLPPAAQQAAITALRSAGRSVEWQTFAGAGHDFANPAAAAYDAAAAAAAWTRSTAFLAAHLRH